MLQVVDAPKKKGPHSVRLNQFQRAELYQRWIRGTPVFSLALELGVRQRFVDWILKEEVERENGVRFNEGFRRGRLSVTPPNPPSRAA